MEMQMHERQLAAHKRLLMVGILDALCKQLELTDTQYQTTKDRYEAVGAWLAEAESRFLQEASIYAQGSIALGTAIKPTGRNEFDVDLVCLLPTVDQSSSAAAVKALIGDRLKAHGKYDGILEEKQRCWRINYANEFHLDITPAILNPHCNQGGELVPDKKLAWWKPTNPHGYMSRFEQYAALRPKFYFHEAVYAEKRADVQQFPAQQMSKPFLKRIVQLLKRHRDFSFAALERKDLAPISIIITTLASWSYAYCVEHNTYLDAFDLITDVVRRMPDFIAVQDRNGTPYYIIENETTAGENFADKWNQDHRLALAFYRWHESSLASLEALLDLEGADHTGKQLQESFGASREQVRSALAPLTAGVGNARASSSLLVAPSLGVVTGSAAGAVSVLTNTFFGR